jgi:hypothetical protein
MALKTAPDGSKYRNEKNYRNHHENMTDGKRIHRKRQLVIKHPNLETAKSHYFSELKQVETSLQKRERIKKARLFKEFELRNSF